ncbi:MAG: RNA-binding cell elongation regulator Jag/EloR [Acidimicrobiales bacterium]
MDWVETTGRTISEALEQALERLGVAEDDAEVIVLEEPRSLMFGLKKTDARVRARVRPVQARAKRPPRRRPGSGDPRSRRPSPGHGREDSPAGGEATESTARRSGGDTRAKRRRRSTAQPNNDASPDSTAGGTEPKSGAAGTDAGSIRGTRAPRQRRSRAPASSDGSGTTAGPEVTSSAGSRIRSRSGTGSDPSGRAKEEEMSVESQAQLAEEFVRGVVDRFGLSAQVASTVVDETIRVTVDGEGIGLLIGPRGSTVDALQELTRTVVQRGSAEHGNRINVDVGGFRSRRAEALTQFARKVAAEVASTASAQALEPMSAVDRKVVHDAVHDLEDVSTTSEGEEPRRYVVIRPAPAAGELEGKDLVGHPAAAEGPAAEGPAAEGSVPAGDGV